MRERTSRRDFLGASAGFAAATAASGLAVLANPGKAAAQAVGVKPGDLPNLTIKEVKTYITDLGSYKSLNGEHGELISIVTESGIEGNYTLGNRNQTPNWVTWAKSALVGKNVMEVLPTLTSTSGLRGTYGLNGQLNGATPRYSGGNTFHRAPAVGDGSAFDSDAVGGGLVTRAGGNWPNWYAAAADVCLWDILGKAVNLPVYKLLSGGCGGSKDKVLAYASSTHHANIEDYAPEVIKAKSENFKGYKIHPGLGEHKGATSPIPAYVGHMEEIKQVREAAGDEFMLAHDPVQMYNRYEALKVGRLLDELNFAWFEDPVRTTDIDSLIYLRSKLITPLHVGEFLYSISDFADYISKGALDVARLIADNVGGISGSMRVGLLADAFGIECTPHNWGNTLDLAVHFHLELALPNAAWFEVPYPPELADHPYFNYKFRPDKDGYIPAPAAPGLGYPIDRDALEKVIKRIDR
jgi:L-alanine-DL-glutamate epimerase-like enolase superfamily enzyme